MLIEAAVPPNSPSQNLIKIIPISKKTADWKLEEGNWQGTKMRVSSCRVNYSSIPGNCRNEGCGLWKA
ncbi:hypothetical protein L2E82_05986 [Cichorium intybus]|uniref:Uncharacterized protein n=1 Tax=Cichorium intybus TaxID=13427 RepID=A0ACB9HA49_CICIN|nr:hypothetical protein L2E82_05986 [Cichorium intybus]